MTRFLSVFLSVVLMMLCQVLVSDADGPRTIEKTFAVGKGGTLQLDLDIGGNLDISGWNRDEVAVTVEISGRDASLVDVDFNNTPSSLAIHSHSARKTNTSTNAHFTIKVPSVFDISLDSKGGGVKVDGVRGSISGMTMGGALELNAIAGEINLKTMGGRITVTDSDATGKVSTMGGSVHIKGVKGNLEGSAAGGKVVYENSGEKPDRVIEDPEDMHASSMGGDIEIDTIAGNLEAKTYGGDIRVSKGKEVRLSTMGGDIDLGEAPAGANVSTMGGDITIKSAGSYVKAKTMGGDVRVDAMDGWVAASTMGGDITVTMVGDPKKGRRDVELKSFGGEVRLTVPAGSSMKFDIDLTFTKGKEGRYSIRSDFPVTIEETEHWDYWHGTPRKHIYGTGSVGTGEHLVRISTINGNIYIRKSR